MRQRSLDATALNALERLCDDIRACRVCVTQPLGTRLSHEPRPVLVASTTAKILIAGQAPGTRVHASGRPFTDPSGVRLRSWLGVDEAVFYDSSKFAIVPMGFCFPGLDSKGSDKPPRPECAPLWRECLMQAMPQLCLILAVGGYAQKWHLRGDAGNTVTETIRNWREHLARPLPIIPLPHPSWRNSGWLKRHPWFEEELLVSLREAVKPNL